MNELLGLVQITLDNILNDSGVRVYWGRRLEDSGSDPSEYIIYSLEGDSADVVADGNVMYRSFAISLQYYVKFTIARTAKGRKSVMDRLDTILNAMRNAGFGCEGGWFEIGDVDEIGFATFRSEYDIPHEMGME